MAKTACEVVIGMRLLALGLAGTGQAVFGASPQHAQAVTLKVRVHDNASVPPTILAQARQDAARIFQHIEVETVWLEPQREHVEDATAIRSVVVMNLVAREMTDRMHAPGLALGIAAGARRATVFYNRIEDLSPRRDASGHRLQARARDGP
jgi:hypothetical protein